MAQLCFYIDEDAMRNAFVSALQDANLDIVTVADVGRFGLSDADQLAWATEQGRAMYSFNVKDFSRLHTQTLTIGKSHAGIIVVPRQRYSIGDQLRGLLNLSKSKTAEDLVDQLVFLGNHL
jgi:hypothetical protein